jgi:hypothetical protein
MTDDDLSRKMRDLYRDIGERGSFLCNGCGKGEAASPLGLIDGPEGQGLWHEECFQEKHGPCVIRWAGGTDG